MAKQLYGQLMAIICYNTDNIRMARNPRVGTYFMYVRHSGTCPKVQSSQAVRPPDVLLTLSGDDASCVVQEDLPPSEWLFHSEAVFPQLQAELFPKCRLARSAVGGGGTSDGNLFT